MEFFCLWKNPKFTIFFQLKAQMDRIKTLTTSIIGMLEASQDEDTAEVKNGILNHSVSIFFQPFYHLFLF